MLRLQWMVGMLIVSFAGFSFVCAHTGYDQSSCYRIWKDVQMDLEIEGEFVIAKNGEVQLRKRDNRLIWVSLHRLCEADQAWVQTRLDQINQLNRNVISVSQPQSKADIFILILLGCCFFAIVGVVWTCRAKVVVPLLYVAAIALPFFIVGCYGVKSKMSVTHPQPRHDVNQLEKLFEKFRKDGVTFRADDDYFYVESNAFPSHPMMVGIQSWQQQVPLPQPYTGNNAWRLPLLPVVADRAISAKKALYRGAIALAVNGVPIFNALNNRGEDTFLAGELDSYGGHCGRGDDYHYHIAPVHLEAIVGKGNPIAFALDGFPLYGYTDADGNKPEDLDELNGRFEKDGSYRYYSTDRYPYINGGMRGVVQVRGDQIDPQPRDAPVRPAGHPLRGVKIVGFDRSDNSRTYTLKYEVDGDSHTIQYVINNHRTFTFTYIDRDGSRSTKTYTRK